MPLPQADSPRSPSGLVSWLAKRLKQPVGLVMSRIDDDTLRRTKYPFQAVDNGDGTTTFKEVWKVGSGRKSHPTGLGSKLDEFRGGVRVQPKEE
ncbi:MAG TPA: hypothetical protein VE964_03090 [Myxococcales bacterium]|nr:hypothetical protein [Myxococcales bacterium]